MEAFPKYSSWLCLAVVWHIRSNCHKGTNIFLSNHNFPRVFWSLGLGLEIVTFVDSIIWTCNSSVKQKPVVVLYKYPYRPLTIFFSKTKRTDLLPRTRTSERGRVLQGVSPLLEQVFFYLEPENTVSWCIFWTYITAMLFPPNDKLKGKITTSCPI